MPVRGARRTAGTQSHSRVRTASRRYATLVVGAAALAMCASGRLRASVSGVSWRETRAPGVAAGALPSDLAAGGHPLSVIESQPPAHHSTITY